MPFAVTATGGEKFAAAIDSMRKQLAELPHKLDVEMFNWQAEDMHRRAPRAKMRTFRHRTRIQTRIHPRGRKHHKPARKYVYTKKKYRKRIHSTRPILRVVLQQSFKRRMVDVLETLKWE